MFSLWSICRQLALGRRLEGETSKDESTLIEQLLRQRFHEAPDFKDTMPMMVNKVLTFWGEIESAG